MASAAAARTWPCLTNQGPYGQIALRMFGSAPTRLSQTQRVIRLGIREQPVNETATSVTVFEALRGRLFGLAYRMLGSRADAEDIGLTIHPHPTLSETVFFTAEMAEGSITDMLPAKR